MLVLPRSGKEGGRKRERERGLVFTFGLWQNAERTERSRSCVVLQCRWEGGREGRGKTNREVKKRRRGTDPG